MLVGSMGGELRLSLAGMIFRPRAILGSATGTLADLHEVVALARSGRLAPIPLERLPREAANDALARLREGQAKGRIVLEA